MTLLLAAIVLALSGAAASAQNVDGSPPDLIGYWATEKSVCRSYHRAMISGTVNHIDHKSWSTCEAKACFAGVISHRRTPDGYVLNLANAWNDHFYEKTVSILEKDRIQQRTGTSDVSNLLRCTNDDAIAGIGLQLGDNNSGPIGRMFAPLYALALPSACPGLKIEAASAGQLVLAANVEVSGLQGNGLPHNPGPHRGDRERVGAGNWVDLGALNLGQLAYANSFMRDHPAREHAAHEQRELAQIAVERDAEEIPSFCEHALGAFGEQGRVLPRLASRTSPDARSQRPDPASQPFPGLAALATFADWNVYSTQSGTARVCHAVSARKRRQPAALDHGAAHLVVSLIRPARQLLANAHLRMEGDDPVITYNEGRVFPLAKNGKEARLEGSAARAFFDWAVFLSASAVELEGSTLEVKASTQGLPVVDEYSLSGFSRAFRYARENCL